MKNQRGTGSRKQGQGMNWVRLSTRLAIYHRDGFCCVYCGSASEEHGVGLTLDHLVSVELGGSNDPSNLVTACHHCNSSKQALTTRGWLKRLRALEIDASRVARRIRALVRRPLDRGEGRRLERARLSRLA
jgi:5-methylcytosine-specific restriction endonuclease McrA